MNLPILQGGEIQQIQQAQIPQNVGSWLPVLAFYDIIVIASIVFDIIIFIYLIWTLYRDTTGVHVLIEDSDVVFLKRFSNKDVINNQIKDGSRVYQVITKPKLLLKILGINVPCFYVKRDIACTVELNDPRDPVKKYLSPQVLEKGLDTTAEVALQTVRVEKGTVEVIGYIGLGVVIGFVAVKLLGV